MISIDPFSREPIYEQLIRRISQLIMVGDLVNGDKLPSVRMLARDLGVNPNTVQKAYAELERSRIIYTVTGKGNFVGDRDAVMLEVGARLLKDVRMAACAARNNRIPHKTVIDVVDSVYQMEKDEEEPAV